MLAAVLAGQFVGAVVIGEPDFQIVGLANVELAVRILDNDPAFSTYNETSDLAFQDTKNGLVFGSPQTKGRRKTPSSAASSSAARRASRR
jgi:hypothetical protein